MRHGWIAVALSGLVACSSKDSSKPEGTGGGTAPVAEPSIPAGPLPVALPTAEAKLARKVSAARAFVAVKKDDAVTFGKLAAGPTPYEGTPRTPDQLGGQIAALDKPPAPAAPPPTVDDPPPPDPDPDPDPRAQGQYQMKPNPDPQLARQQAIDAARQAGVLGSAALQQGGSFASLTGTADYAGLGDLVGEVTVRGTFEPIGTTDVVVLADASAHGDAVVGVLSELADQRTVLAVAGAKAPDALVYRFGQVPADKQPVTVMTVGLTASGATLQGLVAQEQSFPAPFPGRADQPALAKALAAVPDPANSAVAIHPREDATWQQVVDVLAAAAAAKYGAVTLSGSTMRGGFGWGTIGTGRYGTIGRGAGTGTGYGVGRRSSNGPSVTIGQPNSQGDLDKAIIRRYIKRNIAKIQYCYEKQLLAKPGLKGTVSTEFFIRPDGRVEAATASGVDNEVAACVAMVIEQIEFPKPRGGGGVQVRYPFTFREAP